MFKSWRLFRYSFIRINIYLEDKALDPKKSIRDFELFVAGSSYHSDLSPFLPISKGTFLPQIQMPQDGILSHRSNPHSSKPVSAGSSAVFPHETRASPLLCAFSTRTWTPIPCPAPNQLPLTFRFLLGSTPFSQSSMFPKSDPSASHSPLPFFTKMIGAPYGFSSPRPKP